MLKNESHGHAANNEPAWTKQNCVLLVFNEQNFLRQALVMAAKEIFFNILQTEDRPRRDHVVLSALRWLDCSDCILNGDEKLNHENLDPIFQNPLLVLFEIWAP